MDFFSTIPFHLSFTHKPISKLDSILQKGIIRIGTTGDYKPFTYYNPETNCFEGYDIVMGKKIAKDLGVEVRFVPTSWTDLMNDLMADRFDIAMGGISRNLDRQKRAHLTAPYFSDGKTPLIRREDKDRFNSLQDIDRPEVTIGLNPGGTNEKYVKAHINNAVIKMVPHNLDIPQKVASKEVDVMITDSIEALYYEKQNPVLYAAMVDKPFIKSQKVYMIPRGDLDFQNWITLWMEENEMSDFSVKEKRLWGLAQAK
nr:transporter substrate-binding domain-containing protein [Fictibacillus nanhaiensis]